MKVFLTILIISFGAAIGTYFGAEEHGLERAYFMFIGVAGGFVYRHWVYEEF